MCDNAGEKQAVFDDNEQILTMQNIMGRFKPICDNLQFKSIWSDFKQLEIISNNLEQFRMILSNFKRLKQL